MYIIIFLISTFFVAYVVFGEKKKEPQSEKMVKEDIKKETEGEIKIKKFKETFIEYAYKEKEVKLKTSENKQNGFYFELNSYGVTIFENKNSKTIQIINLEPYETIANAYIKDKSIVTMQLNTKDEYKAVKHIIKAFIEKMNNIELKNVRKEENDYIIKEKLKEIAKITRRIEEYGEYNKRIEQIAKVEVPYLINRYENLKVYELNEGKEKIVKEFEKIKIELETTWEKFVEKRKEEYERMISRK